MIFRASGTLCASGRLEKARKPLRELGAPEPEMPPFDASKFEPMPEVEINPPDEFGGQEG